MSVKPSTVSSHTQEVKRLLDQLERQPLRGLASYLMATARKGGTVYTAGNGGSAANASHLAAHLSEDDIPSVCLSEGLVRLTALANDWGYENAFLPRYKYSKFSPNDAVVALSCSGNSANILALLMAAKSHGATTYGILGFGGGKALELCDLSVVLDSQNYGAIEDCHSAAVHVLRDLLATA